jgi:hypothetical protein
VSFAVTGPVAAVFGAQATLVGAGILGGIVTLGFLFLPGMRDVERSGELARTSAEPDEEDLAAAAAATRIPVGVAESQGFGLGRSDTPS